MAKSDNLRNAKKAKNDEFYTKYDDIHNELQHYIEHFQDKIIFCNCDDPEWSNFWKYFKDNFDKFKLKRLISTHYEKGKTSYKLEYDGVNTIKTTLEGDGDFRSDECIEILKEADIVASNPPFSLFRSYISQLVEYDKKFVIIGNKNAVTGKEVFSLIKDNKMWFGYTCPKEFIIPSKEITKKLDGLCRWFTNLDIEKEQLSTTLTKEFNPKDYPKYDNYDAINVDKVIDIPKNYKGIMGVPITFLDKYNSSEFEIIDLLNRYALLDIYKTNDYIRTTKEHFTNMVNGKPKYSRLIIKKK